MKKIYLLFVPILFLGINQAKSQNLKKRIGPSAVTSQFISLWERGKVDEHGVVPNFVYFKNQRNDLFVNAFLKIEDGFDEELFRKAGALFGPKIGNILAAKIPLNQVKQWANHPSVMALDLDLAAEMHLDSARRRTGVDSLQMGFNLPQKFSGKGVVVGVIDAGFDYTHPTFYDTAYQEYRVKKVWEQKNTSGTSPIGFGYGSEFADTTSIFSKKFDINDGTHGTHVAGISSGSGVGSPANNKRRYRGVGYESDMVFTAIYPSAEYWLNTGMVDMLDGIRYTFQYAQSQGKPAVANLSWGCPMGPRDGSSLFSQACNNLVGPGKIFVVSGGNNGQNRIHFTKSFNPADTLTHTFLTFSSNLSPKKILTDIWGDTGKTFEVKFSLYTGSTKTTETSWISLDGLTHDLTLKGANGDTLFITATGLAQEFNQKPHMFLQFFSRINDKLCISIKSDSGTIHMWNGIVVKTSGYYGTFTRFNLPWAKDGDFQYLTGDLVSTKKAISVAAYNTKSSFVNVSNQTQSYSGYQRGRLALFSSVGPTANGKIKPDVAAPGLALASAVSSYDPDYANLGADYASVVGKFISPKNGRTYPFAMAAGTSMAAPMTSGIVALLLQQYPQLDPETLLDWLSQTSISDNFTGTIPGGGNVSWGRGKINGMGLMRKALQITSVGNLSHSEHGILVYPNPAGDRINLYFSERETVLEGIEWADLQGKRLSFEQYQIRKKDENGLWELETGHLKPGIYFLSIQTKTGVEILRIIKD